MNSLEPYIELTLRALHANPLVFFRESHKNIDILNPDADITFEELGMDSLARMELSIWLELELDLEITADEIERQGSLKRLANLLMASAIPPQNR